MVDGVTIYDLGGRLIRETFGRQLSDKRSVLDRSYQVAREPRLAAADRWETPQ